MSKVIRDLIGFALLRYVIGLERKLALPSQPIRCKTKTNHDLQLVTRVFARSSPRLSSDWFLVMVTVVLIGRCDNFDFGFSTLNHKALYHQLTAIEDERHLL